MYLPAMKGRGGGHETLEWGEGERGTLNIRRENGAEESTSSSYAFSDSWLKKRLVILVVAKSQGAKERRKIKWRKERVPVN